MAESLSSERGSVYGANVTQATYLEFYQKYEDVENDLADAQETVRSIRRRRKDLRKTIEASGMNLDGFDRAMRDGKRSGIEREAEDQAYRQFMAWQRKPVGTQGIMPFEDAEGSAAADTHQLHEIHNDGFSAGKGGYKADLNPWTPGTAQFERWHTAWTQGQAEKVAELGDAPPNGAGAPRRVGRPPGPAKAAKPKSDRPKRVITEEHKAAMKAGREAAVARKKAAQSANPLLN